MSVDEGAGIDFNEISSMIAQAAKDQYKFDDKLISYIWARVYDEYHSSFGGCISGMDDMCYFVQNLPK